MHVFLFDIDGTLINSGGAGQAALRDALAEQFQVTRPEKVPIHGCTDRSIVSNLFARHGIEDSAENWQRFHQSYLRRLPKRLASKRGVLLPGVVPLLDELAGRGNVALGLLTGNVPEGARIKLEFYGIYRYFPFGGFGDRHRLRERVARDALWAARRHLDGEVAPERTYVIGDTPHDIRCARFVGARAVAVATGVHTAAQLAAEQPDLLLDDLAEPAELLRLVA